MTAPEQDTDRRYFEFLAEIVKADDRVHFQRRPEATQRLRPYIPGELETVRGDVDCDGCGEPIAVLVTRDKAEDCSYRRPAYRHDVAIPVSCHPALHPQTDRLSGPTDG